MGDITKDGVSPYRLFDDRVTNNGGEWWNERREQVRLENKQRLDDEADRIIAQNAALREKWNGMSNVGPVQRARERGKLAAAARAAGVGVLEHEARYCVHRLYDRYGPERAEWPRPALLALEAGVALLGGEVLTVATIDADTGEIFAIHDLANLPWRMGEIIPLPAPVQPAKPVDRRRMAAPVVNFSRYPAGRRRSL